MKKKPLNQKQAWWGETLACFDFKTNFRLGRQSTKPGTLSKKPELTPSKENNLTFGQILPLEPIPLEMFAEISRLEPFFQDNTVHLANIKHWFEVNFLGISDHVTNKNF